MRYCAECGEPIADSAKFCTSCGRAVSMNSASIIKCPNCGMPLSSLDVMCPGCGCEIQGRTASNAVSDFSLRLEHATSDNQALTVIRSFPIPNTKEDIFDFMVLAVTNLEVKKHGFDAQDGMNTMLMNAWLTKAEQCYQKATALFKNTADYARIQELYIQCQQFVKGHRKALTQQKTVVTVLQNLLSVIGAVLMIIGTIVDMAGGDPSGFQMVGCVSMIVSAATLLKRDAKLIDYGVCALSGGISILAGLLNHASIALPIGIAVLIITGSKYRKLFQQK